MVASRATRNASIPIVTIMRRPADAMPALWTSITGILRRWDCGLRASPRRYRNVSSLFATPTTERDYHLTRPRTVTHGQSQGPDLSQQKRIWRRRMIFLAPITWMPRQLPHLTNRGIVSGIWYLTPMGVCGLFMNSKYHSMSYIADEFLPDTLAVQPTIWLLRQCKGCHRPQIARPIQLKLRSPRPQLKCPFSSMDRSGPSSPICHRRTNWPVHPSM